MMDSAEGDLYDVIVIGSGISGLRCASNLCHVHGMNPQKILVLEGHHSIGGRIEQSESFIAGTNIDVGYELIRGTENELYRFCTERGISLIETTSWSHGNIRPTLRGGKKREGLYYLSESKRLLDADDNDALFGRVNDLFSNITFLNESNLSNEPGSVRKYFENESVGPEMLKLVAALVNSDLYCNLDELSMKEMYTYCSIFKDQGPEEMKHYELEGSFNAVLSHLSLNLNIKTNAAVSKVAYGGCLARDNGEIDPSRSDVDNGIAHVHCADGSMYRSLRVVVAVSVSCLQRRTILFEPGFTECKKNAILKIKFHPAIKIFLKFHKYPWPSDLHGIVMSSCAIPRVQFRQVLQRGLGDVMTSDDRPPVCYSVGFCCGSFADAIQSLTDDELIQLMLKELDDALSLLPVGKEISNRASAFFLGGMVKRWDSENAHISGFAPGSISFEQANTIATALGDKVFFTGEATMKGVGPRPHDAMAAGSQTANAVAASLSAPQLSHSLDRYFSQSGACASIVGFGSLMSESSARSTFPHLKEFRVVRISGYRRVFGHTPSNFVERGMVSPGSLKQASLSAEPVYLEDGNQLDPKRRRLDPNVGFLAVCFNVSINDIADAVGANVKGVGGRMWCGDALIKREEEYNFSIISCRAVTKRPNHSNKHGFSIELSDESIPGLMCVSSTDKDFVERWGEALFREKLSRTGLQSIWNWAENADIKPCSVYTNHCYLAAQSLGAHVLDSFLDETYMVDRKTTMRSYLARNPDVLFCQPPPIHDSRHMTEHVTPVTPPRSRKRVVVSTDGSNQPAPKKGFLGGHGYSLLFCSVLGGLTVAGLYFFRRSHR